MSHETRPGLHLIVEMKVVRPVMGPVRSRFLAHLPAKASVRSPKIPPKSFIKTTLPVSPTRSRFCTQNDAISMKTRIHGGGGRGVPSVFASPRWFDKMQVLTRAQCLCSPWECTCGWECVISPCLWR